MKRAFFLPAIFVFLSACSSDDGVDKYKTPTLDNYSNMSAETLCYRYAYAKENQSLKDEVRARRLDCGSIVAADPLNVDSRIEHQ